MLQMFGEIGAGNARMRAIVTRVESVTAKRANRRTGFIVFVGIILVLFSYFELMVPPEQFPTGELVPVAAGAHFVDIAEELEARHVVRSATAFRIVAKLRGLETEAHAGDYLFKKPVGMFEVLSRVSTGAFGLEPVAVRIPEGITVRTMAKLYDAKMLRFDPEAFMALAEPHEGFLFPDTYHFLPNATEQQIVAAMRDTFEKKWATLDTAAIAATGYSKEALVNLASIVELEAYKHEDRRKIAGVLYNRLAIDMPLQVDVSFVYILGKGTYDLSLEDLKHESPYNTYVYKGLPPGPIGAPSLSSLQAVIGPVASEWIFYLADRQGTTYFSTTYAEHLRKKRLYID